MYVKISSSPPQIYLKVQWQGPTRLHLPGCQQLGLHIQHGCGQNFTHGCQRGKFKLLQLATKIKILRHLSLQTSFGKLVVTDHQRLEVLYVIIIQLLLFFVPEGLKGNLFSITLFNRSLDVSCTISFLLFTKQHFWSGNRRQSLKDIIPQQCYLQQW